MVQLTARPAGSRPRRKTGGGGPRAGGALRRGAALVVSTLVAGAGIVATQAPASAALSSVGPVDDTTHFPAWYRDSNSVALQMCLDGLPNCLTDFDGLVTAHNAGNDAEAFYFNADAEVGGIVVSNALESAYAGDGPDQEMVFVRNQIANQTGGLEPGGTYTVTDPYGTLKSCVANANGAIRNNACRTETVPAALDFGGALGGRIGPFLTWDTYGTTGAGAPPAGYIGDNATPHKVVGSPTGFNAVKITGPGINADRTQDCPDDPGPDCGYTELFVVQGKVQPGPSASLTPAVLDFGNLGAAGGPVTRTLTYRSTGTEPVTVSAVSFTGSADLAVADNCTTGATAGVLAPGESCTVDVTYTPTSGTSAGGSVVVTDSVGPNRTVAVTGSSVGVATKDVAAVAFGPQKSGTTSATEYVVVGNDGVAPLTVGTPTITGTGASHFTLVPAPATAACTAAIAPGGGCEVGVAFAPLSNGARNATLTIPTDGGTLTVPLAGTGTTPVLTLSTASLGFGDQNVGTTSTAQSLRLTNGGTARLFIDGLSIDNAEFKATGGTCTVGTELAPGTTCNILTAFAPTSRGAKTGTLTINADGELRTVALTGNGFAPTTAPLAPTAVSATPGDASASVSWTAPADDGGAAVSGYTVQPLVGGVASGAAVTVAAPSTSTQVTGLANGRAYTFAVRANNSVGASAAATSASVTPRGTPASAPAIGSAAAGDAQATVTWTAPTSAGSSPVASYSVQVVTAAGTVARTVTGVPATATSTVVTGLSNGTTYTFRVRAVSTTGTAGALSVASNAVTPRVPPTATVPARPTAPTAASGAAGGTLTARATWVAPADGGTAINGYVVRALRMSATGTVLGTTTSAVQPGTARSLEMVLPAGNYRFTVQARNAVGFSNPSPRSALVAAR